MESYYKNELYYKAEDIISKGKVAKLWTDWDDPDDFGCTLVENIKDLERVFKYTYRVGWPVIRVEMLG